MFGGGLTTGIALVYKGSQTQVIPVEPEQFDDMKRSLALNKIQDNKATYSTGLCDGLTTFTPGVVTWQLKDLFAPFGLSVSDHDVVKAVCFAFEKLRLVIEPSGAVGIAALLAKKLIVKGKTTVIVVTGGNVDTHVFCKILGQSL